MSNLESGALTTAAGDASAGQREQAALCGATLHSKLRGVARGVLVVVHPQVQNDINKSEIAHFGGLGGPGGSGGPLNGPGATHAAERI